MYSEVFCKVYNEFGWNYYPEIFGEQLLEWLRRQGIKPEHSMDLACGTGVLCEILYENGIRASGMDFSEGMIRIARSRNPHIHYDVADMITYRPDTKRGTKRYASGGPGTRQARTRRALTQQEISNQNARAKYRGRISRRRFLENSCIKNGVTSTPLFRSSHTNQLLSL